MDFDRALYVCLAVMAAPAHTLSALPVIHHSEVVFMGPKDADVYRAYGGTLVSWGGRPWGDSEKALAQHRARVELSHSLGLRHSGGAAFRTAFAGMIDFDPNFVDSVCRTLDGQPILVPWLWDHKHKGHPAYWFCTNAPGYRAYLKHQVELIASAPIDGIHIDDYNGTAGTEWLGGCFCKHCMAAFRVYIEKHGLAPRLKELGVTDSDGFDYGEFLRRRGITLDEYRRKVAFSVPLGREFLTFQYRAAADWVAEMRRFAEQKVGHPLLLSVNSSARDHKSLVIAPQLSFFCGEVHHGADVDGRLHSMALWNFKLAEGVGTPQVATGSGQDWAYIDAHKKPGLVRAWIAQDYAFGHQLMVPHRQWAYTKEKGTHWYQSQPADYAHLYRFVRRYAQLFDDYDTVGSVALVYSNAAFRRGQRGVRGAALWLAEHSIPFHVIVAGDDWLDLRLDSRQLSHYAAAVVDPQAAMDDAQRRVLDEARALGKVIEWDAGEGRLDVAKLEKLVSRQVRLPSGVPVMASARVRQDGHAVLHLLNRAYEPEQDRCRTLENLKVEVTPQLFGRKTFTRAVYYPAPARFDASSPGLVKPVPLPLHARNDRVSFVVPHLDLWGIVALE